jgi:hypothetical protein
MTGDTPGRKAKTIIQYAGLFRKIFMVCLSRLILKRLGWKYIVSKGVTQVVKNYVVDKIMDYLGLLVL